MQKSPISLARGERRSRASQLSQPRLMQRMYQLTYSPPICASPSRPPYAAASSIQTQITYLLPETPTAFLGLPRQRAQRDRPLPAATVSALLRRRPGVSSSPRARSTAGTSRARGVLPRFHSPSLPSSKGEVVRIQGDEFWHMTRVLRLGINDRIELFDGAGVLVEGSIQKVVKSGSDVELLEDARLIAPQGIQWHVFAAFGQS